MEKDRTQQLIDKMYNMVDNASFVPLSPDKIVISKEDLLDSLDRLSATMARELSMYREITDKKGKVIDAARREAEDIIYEAEKSASRIRVNRRTTPVSPLRQEDLTNEEIRALNSANDIYAASIIHADETLTEVCDIVAEAYHNIQSEYENAIRSLEQKASVLEVNKQELINGLESLDDEDRYQQILEISRVLSNELYMERTKARGEQYLDNMQMQLDFDSMNPNDMPYNPNVNSQDMADKQDVIFIPRVNDFMETIKTYSKESGYKLGEEIKPDPVAQPVEESKPEPEIKPVEVLKPEPEIKPVEVLKPEIEIKPVEVLKPEIEIKPVEALKPEMEIKPAEVANEPTIDMKEISEKVKEIEDDPQEPEDIKKVETKVKSDNHKKKKPVVPTVMPEGAPKKASKKKANNEYDEIVMQVLENKKKNGGKIVYEELKF